MGLNLTIDQGNSSAKIAVWDGNTLVDQEIASALSCEQLSHVVERFHPSRALCCSVTGNGKRIAQWLGTQGVTAHEVNWQMPLPLILDYATPQTLGEDRIAAAVGAWSLRPGENSLVVDMGTAVTYDLVSADGHFRGGNIAPGIGMRYAHFIVSPHASPRWWAMGTPLFWAQTQPRQCVLEPCVVW